MHRSSRSTERRPALAHGAASLDDRGSAALEFILVGLLLLMTQMLPEALMVVPLFSLYRRFDLLDSLGGLVLANAAFVLPIVALVLKGAIDGMLSSLDDRSADVVRRRYGLLDGRQAKLADIAAVWGITAERVRQIEVRAFEKLQKNMKTQIVERRLAVT